MRMKCRCKANRQTCDVTHPLCPASSARLVYDETAAMADLYEFARLDKEEDGGNVSCT